MTANSNNLSRFRSETIDHANGLPTTAGRSHVINNIDSYLVGALASSMDEEAWDRAVRIALETASSVARRIYPKETE